MVKPVRPAFEATVKFTVAEALVAVALTMVGTTAGATTETVPSENFSCSTLNSVSNPSPVAGAAAVAGDVLLLSATVREPFALFVMTYCDCGPEKVATSQFFGAVTAQSAGSVSLFTILRTTTRLPGSTRPANTACWSVIPLGNAAVGSVPGPKLPVSAVPS